MFSPLFCFFKPPSFLSWLLPTSLYFLLYFFLTLSGLVSCVTGNVTVSSFFLCAPSSRLLSSLLFLHSSPLLNFLSFYNSTPSTFCFFTPKPLSVLFTVLKYHSLWRLFTSVFHCTLSVLHHISPEELLKHFPVLLSPHYSTGET